MSLARFRTLVSGGLGALLLLFGAAVAQAQTGTITGTVTAAGDAGGALEGARVTVLGTNNATFTNREGVFTLRNVNPGTVQVRVVRLGFDQATQTVTVVAGTQATVNFQLTASPFTLDEIVTTATGDTRKAELGNVVNVIQVDDLAKEAPIKNMSELLVSRAPGVTVIQSAGTTGAGTRIRIRGANSVSLSNEPLLVIDGIRAESGANSTTLGTGGQAPSRINDINPDEIASIEIVKGPSAAALYGTAAANGVILITTKRGSAGRPRWNAWTEQGALDDDNDYEINFSPLRAGASPTATEPNRRCLLDQVARGQCTISEVKQFNPFLDGVESPLGNGYRRQYGLSVSGGSEQAQYFLSAEQEWEDGVFDMPDAEEARVLAESGRSRLRDIEQNPNRIRKTNLRANVTAQASSKTQVNVSAGFIDSKLDLPENDNNVLGILSSGLNGRGDPTLGPGLWGFFRPGETFNSGNQQRLRRLTLSGQANYTPTSWLTARAVVGVDYTNRVDRATQFFGEGVNFGTNRQGVISEDHRNIVQYSVDLGSTATFQLTDDISSKTTGGAQWFRSSFRGTDAFGQFLPPGSQSLGSGATQFADETTTETITLGFFGEQVFGYKDRLFLTGAVRADRNSAVGENFGVKYYPKAAISYLISDESWFPTGKILTSLRLRGAWGKSGLQPGTTAALVFFNPSTAAVADGSDAAALTLGGLGNAALKPETTREWELGFDANFLDSRVAVEVTTFNKKSSDALISVPVPPSGGSPAAQFQNLGSVTNEGIEVTLNGQIFTGQTVSWDATVTGSFSRNRLKSLGGAAPINLNGTTQRAVEGLPLGGYFARTIRPFTDTDGDGLVDPSEVGIEDTLSFQGNSAPTRELSLATGVNLFSSKIRISSQWDYRQGHLLYNLNEEFRCRSSRNCAGVADINSPLFDQIRAVAVDPGLKGGLATNDGFLEDAEFLKLREVAITLFAPDSWTRALRTDRLSLTLSGRNLWTDTNYSGLDPELNGQGNGNFAIREFLTQPPPKQFSARLNVGF